MWGWIRRQLAGAVLGWAALLIVGCEGPGPRAVDPADARRFGPVARPTDFDPQRAEMALADIPYAPDPPPAIAEPRIELPRQALRGLERARNRYAEGRFDAALTEADDALRYHPDIFEAHRIKALAYHQTAQPHPAQQHAERAIALKPDDIASHWLLGRLAYQEGDVRAALRHWRLALSCPRESEADDYATLTHHDLGLLLVSEGYLAAGAEQLELFFQDCVAMIEADRVPAEPALVQVVSRRLGPAMRTLSRTYGMLGWYDAAADTLAVAVQSWPDDWSLRTDWIAMLVRAGRTGRADAEARRFITDCQGCPESLDLIVALHRYTGRPARAVEVLADALNEDPDNTDIALAYVDALLAADRRNEALDELEALMRAHPELGAVRWKLIALSRAEQRWSQWLEGMARHLATHPGREAQVCEELAELDEDVAALLLQEWLVDPDGRSPRMLPSIARDDLARPALDYLLARMAQRLDRPEEAERLLHGVVRADPAFVPAVAEVAERHIAHRRWDEAIAVLETARAQVPGPDATLETLRGRCKDGLDSIDAAEALYRSAHELDPTDKKPLFLLATLHERRNRPSDAVEAYKRIKAIDPRDLAAREGIVRNLWTQIAQTGKAAEVVEQVSQMQGMAPEALPTQRCVAIVRFLRPPAPNLAGYAQRLEELLVEHPEDALLREELFSTRMMMREFDKAERHADTLLERDPLSSRAHEGRAMVSMRLLDFDRAIVHIEQLVDWYPNRLNYLTQLAQFQSFVLDEDAALATWQRVLDRVAHKQEGRLDDTVLTYRGELIAVCRRAERFELARALADSWLKAIPEPAVDPHQQRARRQARFFLLAIDAAAGAHAEYLERVEAWLTQEPDDRELRAWLVGTASILPDDSAGLPASPAGLVALERYDEATARLLAWYQADPEQEAWRDGLIEVLQAGGRHEEAIELATAQVAAAPDIETRVEAREALRDVYRRAGRFDAMLATARETIGEVRRLQVEAEPAQRAMLESYLFDQRRVLAGLLAVAGKYDESAQHLDEMIAQMAQWRQRAEEVGRQADSAALQMRALQSLRQATLQKTALQRMRAYVHQNQGNVDAALALLERAHALMPDDAGTNNDYGYTLADATRDLDLAENMVRLAVAIEPAQAAYLDSLAWVYYKRGRFDEALTWMRRALVHSEAPDPVMHEHLGDVLWRLGRADEAVDAWRKAEAVHARQVEQGISDGDPTSLERVKARLEAVAGDERPPVAVTVDEVKAETQPAS